MGKPSSGGAGGSGGRGRAAPPAVEPERNYREFAANDGKAIDDVIRAQWAKQDPSSVADLDDYQSGAWINYVLRRKPESLSSSRAIQSLTGIDKAMNPLEENTILHRGTLLPGIDAIVNQFGIDGAVGKVIDDKGYISTSYDKSVGDEFRKMYGGDNLTQLRIRAPKGTKGVYMNPNSESHGYQREFLLARNTSLRIVSIQKNAAGYYDIEAEAVQ